MKKIVLTFGLISGAIMSAMMLATLQFQDANHGYVVGYTSMVLAFLLIFFGVRSYWDNIGGGTVHFGRALAVGALIAVASLCYVATWELIYYKLEPDFIAKISGVRAQEGARGRCERGGNCDKEGRPGQVRRAVQESCDQRGDHISGAVARRAGRNARVGRGIEPEEEGSGGGG